MLFVWRTLLLLREFRSDHSLVSRLDVIGDLLPPGILDAAYESKVNFNRVMVLQRAGQVKHDDMSLEVLSIKFE